MYNITAPALDPCTLPSAHSNNVYGRIGPVRIVRPIVVRAVVIDVVVVVVAVVRPVINVGHLTLIHWQIAVTRDSGMLAATI